MNRVDALLASPRAVAALVALVAGRDDRYGIANDRDLVADLGGRIAPDRLADGDTLAAVATDAVRDWRWRNDLNQGELRGLAGPLRPAAEQVATTPAAQWWWQPLARDLQIW